MSTSAEPQDSIIEIPGRKLLKELKLFESTVCMLTFDVRRDGSAVDLISWLCKAVSNEEASYIHVNTLTTRHYCSRFYSVLLKLQLLGMK